MPFGWPFSTMIRDPGVVAFAGHGGKRGKSKRRAADKRARAARKKHR